MAIFEVGDAINRRSNTVKSDSFFIKFYNTMVTIVFYVALLLKELPSFAAYLRKAKHRLIPFVW
jgi:hypothetical protein